MQKSTNKETSIVDYLTDFKTNIGTPERFVSAVGGGALLAYGIKRGDTLGVILSILGSGLALRGATGHCQVYEAIGVDTNNRTKNLKSPYGKGWLPSGKIHVTKSITINKSPAELYGFWRNFENLPQFMSHLESVSTSSDKLSHWRAKAPLGTSVNWNAEVSADVPNRRIGWKSIEGSDIANSGVVEFLPTVERGTEVKVILTYEPPAGKLGSLVAKLFGEEPEQQVAEDLRRFKSLMEAGLIMKTEGQPSARAASA